jgi:hypothetical protein
MVIFHRALRLGRQQVRERQTDGAQGADLQEVAAGKAITGFYGSAIREVEHGKCGKKRRAELGRIGQKQRNTKDLAMQRFFAKGVSGASLAAIIA